MAEVKNKKKLATSAVALTTAAALLLGGTLAWQSISQEALNVAADDVNPGGRLHDDFNGSNKDVYVENFANEPIFARVRLDEYFEYGQDAGKNFDADPRSVEIVTDGAEWNNKATWTTHLFDGTDVTEDYWTWETGGSTVYMPTFNMNKDSLEADINGTFEGDDGTDGVTDGDTADRYSDYDTYEVGDTEEGTEIYDADTNADDEVAEGTAVLGVNYTENVTTHTAKATGDATLISMQEWIDAGSPVGPYWVYDTDGWVYWAQAIEPDMATGLLLDGISLTGVVDDNWYYGINVVGQFITANDLGKDDGTGFYDSNAGTEPSADALALLDAIGVNVSGEEEDGEVPEDPYGFSHMLIGFDGNNETMKTFTDNGYAAPRTTLNFNVVAYLNNGEYAEITTENTKWTIDAIEGELDSGTTVNSGEVTISESQADLSVLEFTVTYTDKNGTTYDKTEQILVSNEAVTLDVTVNEEGPYYTDTGYSVTATAKTASGETVPMEWRYDIIATNEEDSEALDASFEGNSFTAYAAGKYTVNVWAEYMWAQKATTNVTVEANPDSEQVSYAIEFEETPIIGSSDTTGIGISLTADGVEVSDATWEVSGTNATVEGGTIKPGTSTNMSAPLELYTVTAYVDDNKVATESVYMYDATWHTLNAASGIATSSAGNTYYLFESTQETYPAMSDDDYHRCVWKYGDDVDNIYYWDSTGAYDMTGLADAAEAACYGESASTIPCPHFEAYAE